MGSFCCTVIPFKCFSSGITYAYIYTYINIYIYMCLYDLYLHSYMRTFSIWFDEKSTLLPQEIRPYHGDVEPVLPLQPRMGHRFP